MTKIIGVVPARMAASRFPGKPLVKLLGRPLIEHCFERARLWPRWDALALATCDREIAEFGQFKGWPTIWTSSAHVRAMDRVAEAAPKCGPTLDDNDIIICVQADEPMLRPDMLDVVVSPLEEDPSLKATVLGVHITDETLWQNPDVVKLVHDRDGNVVYTSRSPIPYANCLTPELGARRAAGIFAYRWSLLRWFAAAGPSPLEMAESSGPNRFIDHGHRQRVAPYPAITFYPVDSPPDALLVEGAMKHDPLWGKY